MEFFKHEVKKIPFSWNIRSFFKLSKLDVEKKKEKNINLKNINFWKHIKMEKSKSLKPFIKMEKVIKSDDTEIWKQTFHQHN